MNSGEWRGGAWLVIFLGIALVFLVALTPIVPDGYLLSGTHLFLGLLPYVVFGILIALHVNLATLCLGVVLLIVHFFLWRLGWFHPVDMQTEVATTLIYSALSVIVFITGWWINPGLKDHSGKSNEL